MKHACIYIKFASIIKYFFKLFVVHTASELKDVYNFVSFINIRIAILQEKKAMLPKPLY